MLEAEAGFQMAFGMVNQPTETPGVSSTVETITGSDGNEITLYIHRPDDVDTALPCVVHTHGGGMTILTAADPGYVRWRDAPRRHRPGRRRRGVPQRRRFAGTTSVPGRL